MGKIDSGKMIEEKTRAKVIIDGREKGVLNWLDFDLNFPRMSHCVACRLVTKFLYHVIVLAKRFIWRTGPFRACAYIDLWMHAWSFEGTKELQELLEVITETNYRLLSALQTSQVHPWLDINTVKSMNQFFYNMALKHVSVIGYKVLTTHGKGS